ncbi:hypothetical protein PG989_010964 [Apiospora arundinis]
MSEISRSSFSIQGRMTMESNVHIDMPDDSSHLRDPRHEASETGSQDEANTPAPEASSQQLANAPTSENGNQEQINSPATEHLLLAHKPTIKKPRTIYKFWLWELFATLLSFGCMVSVVVIGKRMDGKSLAEWTPLIGINALFSILITVCKAAILLPIASCISQVKWVYFTEKERPLIALSAFDDASKGPWGALLYLNPVKLISQPFLASLGSLLTVVTMAMGPFAQQTVTIRTEGVPKQEAGFFISVASSFNSGNNWLYERYLDNQSNPIMVNPKEQGAFFNGIFELGSNTDAGFTMGSRFSLGNSVATIMDNLADSMTNAIRSGRGSIHAEGITLQQDAIVHI